MLASHRIVYLLGAGFSAPLGIPVMATFLARAKDLYAERRDELAHFDQVFQRLGKLAYAKNYFASDQSNIEEVLSILEMDGRVGGEDLTAAFSRFISDVVTRLTPAMPKSEEWPPKNESPVERAFGTNPDWSSYGHFVVGLFGARVQPVPQTSLLRCVTSPDPHPHYDVVTLNYDRVLEKAADATEKHPFETACGVTFEAPGSWRPEGTAPLLSKLHGSVGAKYIVPPTWQKAQFPEVVSAWTDAHKALRLANAIRVVGYSLPDSDSYVRFLLKSAVVANDNLQQVEAICLDPDGSVKERFDAFLDFKGYRFVSAPVESYLQRLKHSVVTGGGLEAGHRVFWNDQRFHG